MKKEQKDKLEQARDLIFCVEQEWRKEDTDSKLHAANTLYSVRLNLNNAMSRG